MLDRGLSEDGAAQALGWPKARVTARVKLLELPEQAQQLTGQGVIPLSGVEQLRSIGQVSPDLLEAVIAYLGDGNEWAAERLSREPGWVIDSALRNGSSKVFAAHLTQLDGYEIADLRLGKRSEALLDEATALHKQLDRNTYGAPTVRFTESDVDHARAAGVLVEFENARPIIVDRSLYRELSNQAIKRTVEDLRARVAEVEQERKAARASGRPADPEAEARRERGRQMRAIAEQAHGANLDLGWRLMNSLAAVDPADMTVVIWRRRGASPTSLNLSSPASSEALSAVRLPCRPRPWSGGCRISINPEATIVSSTVAVDPATEARAAGGRTAG